MLCSDSALASFYKISVRTRRALRLLIFETLFCLFSKVIFSIQHYSELFVSCLTVASVTLYSK